MSVLAPVERSPAANFVHYLHIVRRRFWILVLPLLLAPVIAYVLTARQPAAYESVATVLLSNLNLAQSLNGLPVDQSLISQPDRAATTQANIARAPEVAAIALKDARIRMTAQTFLNGSAVVPEVNADLLDFKVTNHDPALAVRLATAYAKAFTQYSTRLQTTPLQTAYNDIQSRLTALRVGGQKGSALYANLLAKQQEIVAIQTLETSDTVVVKSAGTATQVAPRPKRSAILGFGVGLLLAIALVFVAEAVDNRVRSAEAIEAALGYPLLARIPPAITRGRKSQTGLSMVNDLGGAQAESIRVLRTSLAFVALRQKLQVVLVTSPREGDGKTTTAANLGIAFARSGRDVIICDLDARKASLPTAFGLSLGQQGLTDVVLGQASLDGVLKTVGADTGVFDPKARLFAYGNRARPAVREATQEATAGKLQILSFGTFRPPNPGEFISTDAVRTLLDDLRSRADLVLIDSPPILSVGDALMLSANVDGILLAVRATATTRGELTETRRLLETVPSAKIGFVLTDTRATSDAYGYGYGYGYSGNSPLETLALETTADSSKA